MTRRQRTARLKGKPGCNPKGIVSFSPRLRGTSYPGAPVPRVFNPNGVESSFRSPAATPLGLCAFGDLSPGSSYLATLGFEPESHRDSPPALPKGFMDSRGRCDIEYLTQKKPNGFKPTLLNAAAASGLKSIASPWLAPERGQLCPRERLSRRRDSRTWLSALRLREVAVWRCG